MQCEDRGAASSVKLCVCGGRLYQLARVSAGHTPCLSACTSSKITSRAAVGMESEHTPTYGREVFTPWRRPSPLWCRLWLHTVLHAHTHTRTESVTEHRDPGAPDSSVRTVLWGKHAPLSIFICSTSVIQGARRLSVSQSSKPVSSHSAKGHTLCTSTIQGAVKARNARPATGQGAPEPRAHTAPVANKPQHLGCAGGRSHTRGLYRNREKGQGHCGR